MFKKIDGEANLVRDDKGVVLNINMNEGEKARERKRVRKQKDKELMNNAKNIIDLDKKPVPKIQSIN